MKASTAVVVPQSTGLGRPISHSASPVATPSARLTRLIVLMKRPMSRCAWRTPDEHQRARARPADRSDGARHQPLLRGEQEVEQDHRRRRRQRERDRLADRQPGEDPALAREPLAERIGRGGDAAARASGAGVE